MSESKPTPGPWTYGVRKNGTIWFSLGDSVKGPHWQADLNAREPDARLMMAAPDLPTRCRQRPISVGRLLLMRSPVMLALSSNTPALTPTIFFSSRKLDAVSLA